jgi:diketogulonate reductase-like aldo/keto reductase
MAYLGVQFVAKMGLAQGWREMEKLQAEGKTRAIGMSNCRIDDLEEILETATVSIRRVS